MRRRAPPPLSELNQVEGAARSSGLGNDPRQREDREVGTRQQATQGQLEAMAAIDGVESGSGNELTPTLRETSAYEFRERAKALDGQADVLNQEDHEGRDHFMEEEESEDELIRADTSGAPLGHSLRQASDLAAAEAPIAAAEAPLAGDAPAASDAAIASASRVQSAIPSEISDFKSCVSAVSMPAQG